MATENRVIDPELLKTKLYEICDEYNTERLHIDRIIDEIDDAPDVDAVEVVHGRWEEATEQDEEFGAIDSFKCSVCGKLSWFEANYCLNCGAKMDGDGNG